MKQSTKDFIGCMLVVAVFTLIMIPAFVNAL